MAGLAEANYLLFRVNVNALKGGEKADNPVWIAVLVEIPGPPRPKGRQFQIQHNLVPRGSSLVFRDDVTVELAGPLMTLPRAVKDLDEQTKVLLKDGLPEKRLELAEWALSRGFLKTCADHMDKLAEKEAPAPAVKAAVTAWRQLQNDLREKGSSEEKRLPRDEALYKQWREKFRKDAYQTRHYDIFYDDQVKNHEALARKLENQFHGFYYWWALRGKALPLPQKRLVVVLLGTPKAFNEWHTAFDNQPLSVEGFYSRRDNLAVLYGTRMDDAYIGFSTWTMQELWQKNWNMNLLLIGEGKKPGATDDEWARAQTMALIQRALQEEAELETISHEGTRQLVAASGLLPPNVLAPEWIQYGMASFFAISRGSLWPGYGGSSWYPLVEFKIWERAKKLPDLEKPEQALERIVTDTYFRQARRSKDLEGLTRAQLLSWSLTYFLAQRKRPDGTSAVDELLRYYGELAQLPRDMEFDDAVHLGCFARAFGLADPSKPRGIDADKWAKFAKDWQGYMANSAVPAFRLEDAFKLREILRGPLPEPPQ
jgi:hypothetical protein